MSILVVDDSDLMREQIRTDLESARFHVADAASGAEALAQLKRGLTPAMIISDVNMPDMDGLTFLERLNGALDSRTPPIFVLSAERSEDARRRARALGVRAWIVKPYDKDALVGAIKKVLGYDA